MQPRHIVFCGGGSGGHLTPAIAVAEQIRARDHSARLTFFTSGRTVDRDVVDQSSLRHDPLVRVIPLPLTRFPGLRLSAATDAWQCWRSWTICRNYLRRYPADAALGTGGFASVPGLFAASRLGVPLVLFEANVTPGRANRWLAGRAACRLSGWPSEFSTANNEEAEFVGIPLRSEFTQTPTINSANGDAASAEHTLLVLGGSQGSRRLNEIITAALRQMELPAGWRVFHQTGSAAAAPVDEASRQACITTVPFIDDMRAALDQASLVVSRAGAITLAEMAAVGRAAILVPLSSAAGNHQHDNAAYFEKQGAAVVVSETDAGASQTMADCLETLTKDTGRRSQLARAICRLDHPAAAQKIARMLLDL